MIRVNSKALAALLLVLVVMAAASLPGYAASPTSHDFDPSRFGRVLTDEELDVVDGDAGLVGAGISLTLFIVTTSGEPWDAKRIGGAIASTALGAINPGSGSGMAAAHLAKNGATTAAAVMNVYNKVSSAVIGIAAGLASNEMGKD